MDKYEYKLCVEEIQSLIDQKKYKEAVDIADTVDWKNEKSIGMLCKISDLYKMCKRYEESRDVLLLAYHRNPSGRLIIYSLCELSLKLKDLENAYEFYREYTLVAPKDYSRLVLKYKIYTARGVDIDRRIATLEELQQIDYKEKWMYELAYLYHCAGIDDKCIEECDQIILFYGTGKYVIKALELKAAHTELTPTQEALYKRLTAPEEPEISVAGIDVTAFNEIDLQKELASNMQEVLSAEAPAVSESEDFQATTIFSPAEIEKALEAENTEETKVLDAEAINRELEKAEMAKREEEILAKADTAEIKITDISAPHVQEPEPVKVDIPVPAPAPVVEKIPPRNLSNESEHAAIGSPAVSRVIEPESYDRSRTNGWGMHELTIGEINNHAIKYPSYDDMVSVQGDGQLSFVMPEEEKIEKQITGQISIDDIMLEWEKLKQKSEKDWSEGFQKRVKEQTEGLFKSFEESAKSGLLEQLESNANQSIVAEPIVITAEPESEDPTPAELTFDRTPFIGRAFETEPDITSNNPEPPADDNTGMIPANDIDYLLRFAEAGEEHDRLEAMATEEIAETDPVIEIAPLDEPAEAEPVAEAPVIVEEAVVYEESSKEESEPEAIAEEVPEVIPEVIPEVEVSVTPEEVIEADSETEVKSEAEPEPEEEPENEEETKEEVEPTPAEPERVTGLTPEQDERFESFIQTDSGLAEIKKALEAVSVEPGKGNLLITSEDKDSAIELGKSIIMELSDKGLISGKVAKIKAETLNKSKDLANTLSSLKDGALMILDAGELTKDTFLALLKAEKENDVNIFMAMIVRRRNKAKFMSNCGDCLGSFDSSIEIEALSDAKLVKLATEYAFAREFAIDEMGLLELHRRIADMQTDSHCVMLTEVKALVDEAINHAVRFSPVNFFRVLSGRRYNANDMIVLSQRDFEE